MRQLAPFLVDASDGERPDERGEISGDYIAGIVDAEIDA